MSKHPTQLIPIKRFFNLQFTRNIRYEISTSSKDLISKDKVTHTGQTWDNNDYRLARFVGRSKHVNGNWAIKLISEEPPIPCKERIVWCDGGDGPLGHPKVYINLDKPGCHTCGYCGLRFYRDKCA